MLMKTPTNFASAALSEAEAAALQHTSYVLQVRHHSCARCGAQEAWTEIFEVWTHPTRTGKTGLIQRRATREIKSNFDIAVAEVPPKTLPICKECIKSFKPTNAAIIPPVSAAAWQETLRRKYATEEPKVKPGKIEPNLDML